MRLLAAIATTLGLWGGTSAHAAVVSEDFSTRARYLAGGTAVWNQALGTVHPTLEATGFSGVAVEPLIVGDGSDGAFTPGRYEHFDRDGVITGGVIEIDTDVFDELQVTTFLLEDGYRIETVGGDPLIIRSLSDVIIRGEIWCHGHSAVGATPGEGRCGGKRGGAGVAAGLQGNDGEDSTAPVTGGYGGAAGAGARGGGGGGSWNTTSPAANGPGFVNTGAVDDPGEGGASSSDPRFTVHAGGAGGGAGGGGTTGMTGAGGGGGGVVIIHAVRNFELGSSSDSTIGFIFANGGDGGDPTGDGGTGAGGGGGGVQVLVGGQITIYSNTAVAGAQAVGGRNQAPLVGAAGGPGRNWFSAVAAGFNGPGFYDPSEELPFAAGDVVYVSTAQSVTSTALDLSSTQAEVVSVLPSPANANFSLSFAGSSDGFVTDNTGWTTDVTLLRGKRYVRFKADTTAFVGAPVQLDAVNVTYVPGTIDQFDFKAAGCGRVSDGGDADFRNKWPVLFLIVPLLLLVGIRITA